MSSSPPRQRIRAVCIGLSLVAAGTLCARVISYAPYSDRVSFPVLQHRMNRHFVLIEAPPTAGGGPVILPPIATAGVTGQVVIYDSKGEEEPRVIFPRDGTYAGFTVAAVREDENGVATILLQTNDDFEGRNASRAPIFVISNDSGRTWKRVLLESSVVNQLPSWSIDVGGPFARSRYSPVRIGNSEYPFVVNTGSKGIVAISTTGSARLMLEPPAAGASPHQLAGSDSAGFRFIVRTSGSDITVVDLNGQKAKVGTLPTPDTNIEGWIAPDGVVYLDERLNSIAFSAYSAGTRLQIAISSNTGDPTSLFAVPTYDHSGAWVLERGGGRPTVLSLFRPATGLRPQWSDVTAPEVEALHAGASGKTLLIQVHRPRPQIDQRLLIDPALAVWRVGEPAPRSYDELFLNEQLTKGFVHVDVDRIENGEPFVFDSGAQPNTCCIIISPAPPVAGGGDVIQEWGVVKASLVQRLVLPGAGRTRGAYDSNWLTDVIFYNPMEREQSVTVRYVPNGDVTAAALVSEVALALAPKEIRLVRDALKTLFGLENGTGAFFITPQSGINVTSRTYTRPLTVSHGGTYGFSMNAIDLFTAASPRFPLSFSGAFPGPQYRTNLIVTDVSGRGTEARLTATGLLGPIGASDVTVAAAPGGQQQFNDIGSILGLLPGEVGGLIVQPVRGEAIASVFTIDNITNDPTYFPPDLPSPVVRTIPAIGHLDGANGAKFRSDLFIFNPSNQTRSVTLQVTSWSNPADTSTLNFTLLPNESRVIRDVLFRLFGRTGIARLRYQSFGDTNSVRVTSRTYTENPGGGTYGFLMPPLNAFQQAGPGDTLEILGVTGGIEYRTNIGLVELSGFPGRESAQVRIEIIDQNGKALDAFIATVASAGGMQIDDVFRARGLGDGPAAALIRVTPLSGVIGAYAAVVDNSTNDPVYLAANLGAK
ncbi:MAG TPA: hypothetical protein VNL91_03560 [Thermoanaerobaculia bacterium]|nr:hypothetical protein [Thermoanaerobaculia bacterium]